MPSNYFLNTTQALLRIEQELGSGYDSNCSKVYPFSNVAERFDVYYSRVHALCQVSVPKVSSTVMPYLKCWA